MSKCPGSANGDIEVSATKRQSTHIALIPLISGLVTLLYQPLVRETRGVYPMRQV